MARTRRSGASAAQNQPGSALMIRTENAASGHKLARDRAGGLSLLPLISRDQRAKNG